VESGKRLSWRIPTAGDPRLLRLALAQVGLASIVAGLVLVATLPGQWLAPALFGLIPLALFMAFVRWKRYQQSMEGEDNVWLDAAGLHWLDDASQERMFRREEITGFHIGDSHDTLRPVSALSLYLRDGFESQPFELHPPATADAVRETLSGKWNLVERAATPDPSYDVRVEVFSECHAELQQWHWEGTGEQLSYFFGLMGKAADELPAPRPGVKPAKRIILANRREPRRVTISHWPVAQLDEDQIAAPANALRQIADRAAAELSESAEVADRAFEVDLAGRGRWTFHLHVRPA
jgi:hypothetical protein